MKNKLQNDVDDIISYIEQWNNTEDWDAMQCMLNAAVVGCPDALEHAADYIVGTGAINSETCYPHAKSLEQDVELLAKRYRKLSKKRKDLVYDRIFDGVLMVDCQDCNHVCFVHDGNEEIYPEVRHKCWSCKSENLNSRRYKSKLDTSVKSYQKESA